MRFQCPNCTGIVAVDDVEGGKAVACGHCSCVVAVPLSRFTSGAVIGDFVIKDRLGEGAVGTVYLAHQISLDRSAALKIMRAHLAEDQEFQQNFLHEARAAAKLNHPGIVQAYAVGDEDGIQYFAMEYVEGSTLKQILTHSGRIVLERALTIAKDVAVALNCAWTQQQLVHQDIKPDNIILTENGHVKLADLGLAKVGADLLNQEPDDSVYGTPQYISPEQLLGKKVDCRSDIYSLGATLYHCLTGRYPFSGSDPAEIASKHVYDMLTPAREIIADIPKPVSDLVQRMMEKQPERRPQTYIELIQALTALQEGKAVPVAAAVAGGPPPDGAQSGETAEPERKISLNRPDEGGKKKVVIKVNKPKSFSLSKNAPTESSTPELAADISEPAPPVAAPAKGKIIIHGVKPPEPVTDESEDAGPAVYAPPVLDGMTYVAPAHEAEAMPTDNSGDGRPLEPALPASPFESTPSAAGKKKSLIFALAAVLTVTALGGGGYFGYGYMQKSREIANEDGAVAAGAGGRGIVAEVRAMVSAGNARKDVLEKASGFVSNNPESSEVAELQAFVEPLVEEELRDLRKAQIDQELSQWETRSKELQAEQQQRQAALDEQRRQEAEARRVAEQERRVREQRDREIAALKATQNDLRIQSIELCREKRYAEAKLLHVPMAESSEPEFSRWAVNRLKCLEYAEKAFSLVANSKEMLKGRPFPVPNQPRPGTIQYISRRTIEVSYKIRELQGGDFIEKTETVNIPLTAVKGPQMWQLCDGAWDQNDKTELQLMFGAYLLSDGSFLSEARKKLEESNSPNVTAAMLKEIEELEPLLKQRQWETHMQKLTALVDQGNAKEAVRFAKQLKDYYPDLYAQQEREIERLLRLK